MRSLLERRIRKGLWAEPASALYKPRANVPKGLCTPSQCCVAHGGDPRPRQFLQQRDYSSGTKFRESRAQVGKPAQRTVSQDRAESLFEHIYFIQAIAQMLN